LQDDAHKARPLANIDTLVPGGERRRGSRSRGDWGPADAEQTKSKSKTGGRTTLKPKRSEVAARIAWSATQQVWTTGPKRGLYKEASGWMRIISA
jgi:hypothetical protein